MKGWLNGTVITDFCPISSIAACKQPLGVENGIVEDAMITASSWYSWNYEPFHARLHGRTGEGGWCAKYNDNSQYLQVQIRPGALSN